VLTDLTVSRHHAELLGDAARGWEVVDLGSANGTFVNGQRVSRSAVREGDRISFGNRGLVLRQGHLVAEVDATRVTLEAIGLAERSPQGVTLLDDISFRLGERSFLAAVGPSGAGKTTLLGALTGLRPADTGTVRYDGIDLAGSYEELRLRVGYVPQEDILHPQLTPRRALRYAAELRFGRDVTRAERETRVEEVLGELGLTERADLQISKLSGGQRKRVSIALELLTRPSLLFLDEPTSGLDPGMEKHLMQLLRQLADGGRTIVVVTHSVQSLTLCDRVLFLAPGGRIAYFGPADEALGYFGTDDLADVFSELERRRDVDWKARFLASPLGSQVKAAEAAGVARETRPPPERRRQGVLRQLSTLTRRYTMVVISDRGNLLLLVAQAPILALFVVLAIKKDGYQSATIAAMNPGLQVALFLCISATYLGAGNAIREIVKELPLFIRERTIGLSITAYLGSKVIVLSVITIVQAVILVYVGSLRQGPGNGGTILPWIRPELLLVLAATGIASMGMGLLVSALVDRPDRALTLLPVLLVPQLVLSFPQLDIQDRPLLNQLSYVATAQWGYAAFASSIDLDHMVYIKARSVSPVIPPDQDPARASAGLVQQVQTATDLKLRRRWGHSPTVWLEDMGALGALLVLELVGSILALRRRDAARAMRRQRRRRRHRPRDGPLAAA
ncbi:MAG: ATP-binding cassette domain-containing protein, partial [Candidatus Dormibacteraeota bacterium]|nr:ATP-binding cassette domain-containing protein [Candidatus Dormibacteraeota bacterium]